MKKALVIGSGAGGATVAKELQGRFDVTVLEAGEEFRPFSFNLSFIEKLKKTGLFFDEREIQLLFPKMKIRKTPDKMVLVNGITTGGTTTLATGNALRQDNDLVELGINLDEEFAELAREIPISTGHQKFWREPTKKLFAICQEMGLNPRPTPKMGNYQHCRNCGNCVLGCRYGIKWDSRQFLKTAIDNGAKILMGCQVEKVVIENDQANGLQTRMGWRRKFFPADLIVLAAGGLGTPAILQNSQIDCEPKLFVDPVLCVATEWQNAFQNKEISMPFVVQRDHLILSPYFDHLSYFFNKNWKARAKDILSLMIKLADSTAGSVSSNNIKKTLTAQDNERLQQGVEICTEIFRRLGIENSRIFFGTMNAGHPGGMLPLTADDAKSLHNPRLPENLYIADATLFPNSLGNPPMLTIMAMAKRVSKMCVKNFVN